jgi:hypothetical protein
MNISRITLDKLKIGCRVVISKYLLDASSDVSYNYLIDALEANIRGYIWGESQKGYSFKYPTNWWQALKERWFPMWMKKKFPVLYTTQSITVDVIYPDLKISLPEHQHQVVINHYESLSADKWEMSETEPGAK